MKAASGYPAAALFHHSITLGYKHPSDGRCPVLPAFEGGMQFWYSIISLLVIRFPGLAVHATGTTPVKHQKAFLEHLLTDELVQVRQRLVRYFSGPVRYLHLGC